MSDASSHSPVPRATAARLAAIFAEGGYVRRFAADKRSRLGPATYKKGFEVRLIVASQEALREVRHLLGAAHLRAGKPYRKHSRLVQPVYGKDALDWFLALLPGGRDRAAAGFTATGARTIRRLKRRSSE